MYCSRLMKTCGTSVAFQWDFHIIPCSFSPTSPTPPMLSSYPLPQTVRGNLPNLCCRVQRHLFKSSQEVKIKYYHDSLAISNHDPNPSRSPRRKSRLRTPPLFDAPITSLLFLSTEPVCVIPPTQHQRRRHITHPSAVAGADLVAADALASVVEGLGFDGAGDDGGGACVGAERRSRCRRRHGGRFDLDLFVSAIGEGCE